MAVRELRLERENSKLNLEELTNLLDGGKEFTEKRRMMSKEILQYILSTTINQLHLRDSLSTVKLILDDPVFSNNDRYFLTADEAFDDALKKNVHIGPQYSNITNYAVKRLFGT